MREQIAPLQRQSDYGKSIRVSNIVRHSRLWLLDYFRCRCRIGRGVVSWIDAGGRRAAQLCQRNSQRVAIEVVVSSGTGCGLRRAARCGPAAALGVTDSYRILA
jgi:hypothetical protein